MFNVLAWIGTDCNDLVCEVQLTIFVILTIATPFIVGAAILGFTAYNISKYFKTRKNGDLHSSRKFKKIILFTAAAVVIIFLILLLDTFLYERKRDQRVLNAGFSIYAPPNHELDIEYLRQESDMTVPHVQSRLATPLGTIRVIQGSYDSEVQDMFRPPDKCDIDELYEYLGVWGKENKSPTVIECTELHTDSGWVVLKTSKNDNFGNRAPYAARLNNTIIVFHAFRSTAGEFRGTPDQAQEYVLKFLNEAKVVNPNTLL